MDYQILVNIAVGVITLMGGWVFKMILGTLNEIKGGKLLLYSSHVNSYNLDVVLKLSDEHSVKTVKYPGNSLSLGKICGKPFRVSMLLIKSSENIDLNEIFSDNDNVV